MSSVQVVSNIHKVKSDTDKTMKRAATMIGGTIEGHAKEYCPVDTGLLRNSITYALGGQPANMPTYRSNDKDKTGKQVVAKEGAYTDTAPTDEKDSITVYVGTNVQYAPYQELGAPNINLPARPFLRPAFENHRNEIEQILETCFHNME